jgi:peptidyl-prolyl cis-trans isomerase C
MELKKITAAIATLLIFALPACSTISEKTTSKIPIDTQLSPSSQPVQLVNGVPITRAELDRTVKALLAQNGMPPLLPPEMMKQAEEMALNQLISTELLYQEAGKIEIKDLDKLVAEQLVQGKAKFASEADYEKAFKESGMTPMEVRENARKLIIIKMYVENRFASKETVTDAEAKKFYDENVEKYFKKSDRVKASHILIGVDRKATPEEKRSAREKAEAILRRVQAGEDFAAIARKESTCESAARGGDLGIFGKGQMTPPFEKAAFALKPGEVSSVVETMYGYHIIKVAEKIGASTEPFEQVMSKIVDFLKEEKVKKAVSAYVEELRGKAKMEKV